MKPAPEKPPRLGALNAAAGSPDTTGRGPGPAPPPGGTPKPASPPSLAGGGAGRGWQRTGTRPPPSNPSSRREGELSCNPISTLVRTLSRCGPALHWTVPESWRADVTPDSFSDGGDFLTLDTAIAAGLAMAAAGADIIDVGGESTRPRALPTPPDLEQARILPVIRGPRLGGITRFGGYTPCIDYGGSARCRRRDCQRRLGTRPRPAVPRRWSPREAVPLC